MWFVYTDHLVKLRTSLMNYEQLLSDIVSCDQSFLLIAGDFNTRTLPWWRKDSTTSEGTQIFKHLLVLIG